MLDDIRNIKSGVRELREFGLTVGGVLIVIGVVALWRGKAAHLFLFPIGGLLVLAGCVMPRLLMPFQKAWMALALMIGFVMSRLILAIVFYGVMMPIGLAMRLLGKDILEQKIDRHAVSYWRARPVTPQPKKSYENQY